MQWNSPVDAVPWVGLYVCVASLICTLAMAADALHGFRQWKLWFPCRYFTINAASITLLAIAMKLPVDLNSENVGSNDAAKLVGIIFLVTVLANFLPSLGLMDDKQLLMNIVALGILIVTITVNVWIEYSTSAATLTTPIQMVILIFFLPLPFSVALTVSASRRILHHRYEELHKLGPNHQEIKFSYKRLMRYVKRYWMMAETGNPQFAIASSPVSYALGVICLLIACISLAVLISLFLNISDLRHEESDYKWSIAVIVVVQLVGAIVGSIAPIFRFLTATSYFNLSKKWSKKHLNVFRVEKQYIQRLQLWKRSPVPSYIPGRHCKKVFYTIKNMTLNLCIALQITVVVICNTICLVPRSFLILLSCSYSFFKSLLKRFKAKPVASNSSDVRSEMEEYSGYVLQIEVEPNLSKRILRNTLKSITRLLHESEKKEPSNLMKLLKKSTGFYGVVQFDNDQVPPLHQEETQNCWSLVLVTLTAIALALPNIGNEHKWLLSGMREGLQIVRLIEESLNGNGDLVKSRKAARRVWTDIEVYRKWLEIELQKKSRKGETTKDILRWLGDEAIKIVIEFKRRKNGSLDHSLSKFIAASSMYRISQTILLHCEEQENWPKDEEIFEFISTIIADLLLACFTNLPRVITMKCHDDAIEKREDNIRIAAQLLGKSKKILKILKARQLPNIDPESMAYIDKWHVLPKSQLPNACSSSARIQSPSANSSISIEVIIM